MEKQTVKELEISTIASAKYINVSFMAKGVDGKMVGVNIMLGRGDDLYTGKIIELMKAYMLDGSVDRMIELWPESLY